MAIIAKFALKDSRTTQFIVATTHLLYNPRRDDVRLAQTQVLLAELDRMAYRQTHTRYPHRDPIPIIMTGDFNLQYVSESYRLINNGFASLHGLNLPNRSILIPFELGITDNCQHFTVIYKQQQYATMLFNSERQQKQQQQQSNGQNNGAPLLDYRTMRESSLPFNTGRLTHNLNFTSAIHHRTKDNRSVASTYHREWITVDYIFYTKFRRQSRQRAPLYTTLQLLEYLELPSVEECCENGPIPNAHLGSDHFSLVSKFVLYKSK